MMTVSADLPGFQAVDATQLDVSDPADLVDLALARAGELLPDWQPREGNVEVVLLEEFAVLLALLAARIEAVVPEVTAQILALSGLQRDAGTPARVAVEVSMSDTLGHVVPAGVSVVFGDPNAEDPITGTLEEDVSVPSGESVGYGTVAMDEVGEVQGLTVGADLLLIDAVVYVDAVTITNITSPGTDAESQASYLGRGSGWLQSMTLLLGRPDQFATAALVDSRVARALGVQRWDGSESTPGTVDGSVTVLALGSDGLALDPTVQDEVIAALTGRAVAEIAVTVQAPNVVEVPVTGTISLLTGAYGPTVEAAVAAGVAEYLNALTWEWGQALRLSRLIQVIETVAGVDSVVLSEPFDDVVLDDLEVLRAGVIDVVVA